MNTPPATYRHKTIVLLLSCIVGLLFLSSCEKLGIGKDFKCRGCPEEQPWGAYGEDYCYPTEEACQQEYGEECQKCDRKPKEEKQ